MTDLERGAFAEVTYETSLLDSSTGVLSGTPTNNSGSPFSITLTTANGTTPNATQAFTLTVQTPQTAPIITSPATATFAVGEPGSFTVTATGFPAPTFSATGLPTWASLDPATGAVSGTPPNITGAPFTINLTATNGVSPKRHAGLHLERGNARDFYPVGGHEQFYRR